MSKKLCEFRGVGGVDLSLGGILSQATSMAQQVFQEKQEALTGPEALTEHVMEGVHWNTQTVAVGGTAVMRSFLPDQQCPGGFAFLAKKVVG